MAQAQRSFVRSPHLRQMLGRFATYVGASPYLAPATLNVIAHVEMNEGIWYPEGGVYAMARAYQRLAVELGVEIRPQAQVTTIDVKNGQAQGVRLADGRYLSARAVIANVDVATVYEQLLPNGSYPARHLAQLRQVEPSCSGFILLLGIGAEHPDLAQHNIFFSADYPLEFHQIFEQGIPPTEPTIYVAITAKTTPGDAPAGMENWFVLVNAPPLGPGWDWRAEAVLYRNRVLELLAARGYDVRQHIVADQVLTPVDIAQMTGARRGALYGASSNNRMAAFRRPHNRAPDIRGLYFVGGTTHPGGGVPMVTLSGKVASEFVLQDIS
jgi:phytoene desaturase